METKKDDNSIEQQIHNDLHQYLLSRGMVDERLPQAPDIEELWTKVGESYLPDGMREFGAYPIVSIGWMMFIGMAIAKFSFVVFHFPPASAAGMKGNIASLLQGHRCGRAG